ncbi:hypothetical protein HMPREF1142_1453 [Peptostreptococcaceae bacterium AS15]|nr:hypothetical protein HMPREF1142_1453 [Peptostreptococcaceae bacterium AS15]
MKKYLSIIISLLILTVFMSMNTFAVDNKQYVEFHNQRFKISELSKETLDWLKWYNSLSDDSKEMVNYVPGELLEKSLISPKGDIAVLDHKVDLEIIVSLKSAFFKSLVYEYINNSKFCEILKKLKYKDSYTN